MNTQMEQLIDIFAEFIRENHYITFAYSRLEDCWYLLTEPTGGCYDSLNTIHDLNEAYQYMLEECQYYWLEKNHLLRSEKMPDEIIDELSPEIRELLQKFTAPYEKQAQKVLMQ